MSSFRLINYNLLICFCTSALLLNASPGSNGKLVVYPVSKLDTASNIFTANIDGHKVFVKKYKDIHYIHFAYDGVANITMQVNEPVTEWRISSKASMVNAKLAGDRIYIQMKHAAYVVITVNHHRLFLFRDESETDVPELHNAKALNVLDLGVDNTGASLTTVALQKALDLAAAKQQVLYFPEGIYLTGTIKIHSNTRVYLAPGAIIKGSEKREDFPVDDNKKEADHVNDPARYTDNGEWMTFSRLLLIDSAVNVKIWGRGIIDGSGSIIRAQGKPANLIRIRSSRKVIIDGIILRDPACWNTHILHSKNIIIKNVKLLNDRSVPNTDGFDPDASKNVLIENSFAYCSDDNVAVKSTNNNGLLQNCENITVRNCVFLTKKSALKVGTETKAAFMRNINFIDNYVVEADRGIVLYCYDGSTFDHIRYIGNYFERLHRDNQQKCIHMQIRNRSGAGKIKNVLIRDCTFGDAFQQPSEIMGYDKLHMIEGVKCKNLVIAGKRILSPEMMRLTANEWVTKFECK